MFNKTYSHINNVLGWICFAIAAWTYLSTVEPSISFWDCPEYVACAAKGEVGHPPGNAFFLLAGRFFANFAGSDATQIALWVNRMSALFSACTILLLFWTITMLTRSLVQPKNDLTWTQACTIWGSGLVGALTFTWSDTFWFSAVEAEVYGFSSFMTALTFWLMLKWRNRAGSPSADRYLILIAYVVGLSIGVHLLNLLCLPAIVLVAYYRLCQHPSWRGTMLALLLSVALIALILFGIIPGVVWWAQRVELLLVNGCRLPYNSGALLSFALLLTLLVLLLVRLHRGHRLWGIHPRLTYNVLLSLLMILMGYSTFAQVIIRSTANTPLNENAPDNVFALGSYLNRDQYGQKPLLWGQTFASTLVDKDSDNQGRALYAQVVKQSPNEPDRYYVYGHDEPLSYDYNVLFPRLYSNDPQHIAAYKQWCNYTGEKVSVRQPNGATRTIEVPSWRDNWTYFIRYQVNHMYWRYFLWNFCGRQNDLRGNGEADRGNWLTGISVIDGWLLGSQEALPVTMTANKGHNVYYMLPLLLGLLGIAWQGNRGKTGRQGTLIVSLLFVMTGLAIVVYLNQTPNQPRERDYAFAGSFYAFAIWIGMGVAAIGQGLQRLCPKRWTSATVALSVLLGLGVPLQMVGQTWDDHDRSDRRIAHDFALNYLASLDQDAILFVSGDNETFPLWYAIEVEGVRRDVRICNLAYLQTDWYIDQMRSPQYDSPALPIPMTSDRYAGNKLMAAYIVPRTEHPVDMHTAMSFLYNDEARFKVMSIRQQPLDCLPAQTLLVPVVADAVRQSPCIHLQKGDSILPHLTISLANKRCLPRQEVAQLSMLDSIARNGWQRPLYFAYSLPTSCYVGMQPYTRTVGLANQIVPLKGGGEGSLDVERTYDLLMNRFQWGNIDSHDLYLDENCLTFCFYHRMLFGSLIEALEAQGDGERALQVAERALQVLPERNVPYDRFMFPIVHCLAQHGRKAEAEAILGSILAQADDYLRWASSLRKEKQRSCLYSISNQLYTLHLALNELSCMPVATDDASSLSINSDSISLYLNHFKLYHEQFQTILQAR